MPVSAGMGKIWKFGDGHSLNTAIQAEWMIYRQFAPQTEQFTLNFQVSLLLPQLDF
jgi:hypothetical protein